MSQCAWHNAVSLMSSNLVKIENCSCVGSGVLFQLPVGARYNRCVLTAHHVIEKALATKGPIVITPENDRKSQLTVSKWAIVDNEPHDHAIVMFNVSASFPALCPYDTLPATKSFKPGVEIGWMGYPGLRLLKGAPPNVACFSHGYISAYLAQEQAYLIDGVSIHGMSGGPAFVCNDNGSIVLAGIVTNYFANRRPDGTVLPGMAMFRTIKSIQKYYESERARNSVIKA